MTDPEAHGFGWALEQMQAGRPVRRRVWATIGRPRLRLLIDQPPGYAPFLAFQGGGASGELRVPHADVLTDVLAEDWELADPA